MLTIDYNSYRTTTPTANACAFLVLHYTALDFAASVKALTTGAASAHYLIRRRTTTTRPPASRASASSTWSPRKTAPGTPASAAGRAATTSTTLPSASRSSTSPATTTACSPSRLRALADQRTQATGEEHPAALPGHDPEERGRPLRHRRRAQVRPGPKLPGKELYGGRYRRLVRRRHPRSLSRRLRARRPAAARRPAGAFRLYGYVLPATVDDAYFASLLRAFQMHFRPENDGALDVETAAILYALNEKYPA